MAHTAERCEHDDFHWFPRSVVEKYSPDQTAFAERRMHEELSWGRRLLVTRFGLERVPARYLGRAAALVPRLHGDWLRDVFPSGPEGGIARTEGNILVTTGLQNLGYLLIGTTASGANGRPLAVSSGTAGALVGVGTGTTAATQADTHLQVEGATTSYYQVMDSTYPTLSGTGVAGGGQLNGQMTAGSGSANFNWQEWCWASSTGTVTAGTTLASVATNTALFNHWVGTSLGTKGSGATWVFSTTVTFS